MEQLIYGVPCERVKTLCEADNDGRCDIWPCKVGQRVKVRCDTWGNVWNFKTIEYGKFLTGEIIGFVKTRKQSLMKIQVEHNVSWKRERQRYPISALGVTVFLLPEAAEAALEASHA